MHSLLIVALAALVVYLLLLAGAWHFQERVVWQPPRAAVPAGELRARRIEYAAEDGQPLFAYLVGEPARARGLIVACHGNADLAAWFVPWAEAVAQHTGWAVLVPEYRGYAGLPGAPHYAGSQLDARATYALARDGLGVAPERIALYGHSLGSAIATEIAAAYRPAVLLLESPFTSIRDMARARLVLPVSAAWQAIGRVHFDTRTKVAALDVSVWVAHGERDLVIPARMGRAVHEAARVKGELLLVPGAGHNDVAERGGARYWAWLAAALGGA